MQTFSSIIKRAQYYETDAMGVVHHSNHLKWMEEARTEFLREVGFDWAYIEREVRLMIPVLFQSVDYKCAIRFDDSVEVVCSCNRFNGVKMDFSYEFKRPEDNVLLAKGITKHGFVNCRFEPVNLKDTYMDGYKKLDQFINGRKAEWG